MKNKNYKKNNYQFLKTTTLPSWHSWEYSSLRQLGWSRTSRCNSKISPPALAHPQLELKNPLSVILWSAIFTSRLRSTTLLIKDFLLVNPFETVGWWEMNVNSEIFFFLYLSFMMSVLKYINLSIDSPSFEAPS